MKKLNELQSYLTRLRGLMLTVIILCSIGIGNAWGADATVTLTFEGSGSFPNNSNWTCEGTENTSQNHTTSGSKSCQFATTSTKYITYKNSLTGIKSVSLWGTRTTNNGTNPTFTVQKSTDGGSSWTDVTSGSFSLSKNSWSQKTYTFTKFTGMVRLKYTCGTTAVKIFDDIEITYEAASDPKYTLKVPDGEGGYVTYSNKVKADLTQGTAEGGHDCSGDLDGSYSGWHVGEVATPIASPGTTYNHMTAGDMPSDGSTLYALFRQNSSPNYWHTKPLCEESCLNIVTPEAGTKTNVTTIAFNKASVETCSETAADRQVTITITPASCYTVPSSTRLDVTGATYVSGPTDNGNGTYSFVYQFAQNATGTKTFNASLSTTATYTVSYAKGNVPSGGGSISGSHANDTKTCGTSMALPGETFHTTGYTQTGWSKTNGGSQYAAVGGSYTDNAAQTFYPVWTVKSYSVTWMVNNTTYSAGGSASVNHGSHIATLPTAPSPASYCGDVFVGWTTDENYVHNTSPLYTTASGFPTASGAQVFYAVFADYAE